MSGEGRLRQILPRRGKTDQPGATPRDPGDHPKPRPERARQPGPGAAPVRPFQGGFPRGASLPGALPRAGLCCPFGARKTRGRSWVSQALPLCVESFRKQTIRGSAVAHLKPGVRLAQLRDPGGRNPGGSPSLGTIGAQRLAAMIRRVWSTSARTYSSSSSRLENRRVGRRRAIRSSATDCP